MIKCKNNEWFISVIKLNTEYFKDCLMRQHLLSLGSRAAQPQLILHFLLTNGKESTN